MLWYLFESDLVKLRRVLVSVSDKTSIVELCRYLTEIGAQVISTGGSAKKLIENGIAVTEVRMDFIRLCCWRLTDDGFSSRTTTFWQDSGTFLTDDGAFSFLSETGGCGVYNFFGHGYDEVTF